MKIPLKHTLFLLLLINGFTSIPAEAQSPHRLLTEGKIEEARSGYLRALSEARESGDRARQWQAMMAVAWFESEVSQHRTAIEYSNQALELASSLGNDFMIGRSLCWLGWSYSYLGLYDLALSFFENAEEIGAPEGVVKIVPVWGLAVQEIGAIYFKTGDTSGARERLEQTFSFAKDAGIAPGISEGGIHLAEIALSQGKLAEAKRYADDAVQASQSSGCSPFIAGQARVVQAKVALAMADRDKAKLAEAKEIIEAALTHCEDRKLNRCVAESKLLLSRTYPKREFDKRFGLVSSAFELLSDAESELRGSAEAELGRVFLDDNQKKLAQFYLKNGLKVNDEMFRKVDNAYIKLDLAALSLADGEEREGIANLRAAIDAALETKAYPLALDAQYKLAFYLTELGYDTAALEAAKQGLESVARLKQAGKLVASIEQKQLELLALSTELGLRLGYHRPIEQLL